MKHPIEKKRNLLTKQEIYGDAVIQGDYRYQLRRMWSAQGKVLAWVLLNPSM